MTPETTRDLVPLYVLGELKGEERVAFEMALHRSPELKRAVHDCSEAFADVAAAAAADCQPSHRAWQRIERQIAPAQKSPAPTGASVDAGRRRIHLHWAWPVAATFLLGLNVLQWSIRREPADSREAATVAVFAGAEGSPGSSGTGATAQPPRTGPEVGAAVDAAAEMRIEPSATEGDLDWEYRRLARENRRLIAENADLREIVVPLVRAGLQADLIEPAGVSLWMAELREKDDGDTTPQNGLWGRLRDLVPEAGVALVPDRFRIAQPAGGSAGITGGVSDLNTFAGSRDETPLPAAFALAVINADEGIGYLDLYNLPVLPQGAEMRLWVQREGRTDFTAVGAVPGALSGGSGGLAFRVEVGTGRPSRVMITIEPAGTPPLQPAGPVVIEGP